MAVSQGLEPMLIEVDQKAVRRAAGIVLPEIGLPKADQVEGHGRQAASAIGAALRVGEAAVEALDPAEAAADIEGRADMALDGALAHPHAHARPQTGLGHAPAGPAARRASISARVRTPFSTRRRSMVWSQRS